MRDDIEIPLFELNKWFDFIDMGYLFFVLICGGFIAKLFFNRNKERLMADYVHKRINEFQEQEKLLDILISRR